MKKIGLFIAISVLAAFLYSPIVFADARVATANDQVWGGTGIPAGGANVTQAAAGDTLNIAGYRVYITNDQTANDGSGLNIFNLSTTIDGGSDGALVCRNGSANDLDVNFASSVDITSAFTVDNNLLAPYAADNVTTIDSFMTIHGHNLTVANYDTGAATSVSMEVKSNLQIDGGSGDITVYADTGAATLTLGQNLTLIGGVAKLDDIDGGLATLTLNGAGDQAVTGTIDGWDAGDGTLNVNGAGDTTFNSAVGNTNSLLAVNIAAADTKTAEFDGVLKATTVTMSGVGKAQFDGAVTATDLNVTSTGEAEINAASAITTTTFTGAGTLDLNETLTGSVAFGAAGDGTTTLVGGKNITGTVNNTSGGDGIGTLTVEAGGDSNIGGAVGATNALKAVNVASAFGQTADFDAAVSATTVTMSGAGTANFDGAVTATALNITSTGTATLNTDSNVTTTTLNAAGTLDLDGNLTGDVDFNVAGGTVDVADTMAITGTVDNTSGVAGRGTLNFLGATTTGGNMGSAGAGQLAAVNFNGATTLAHNIVSAATNVNAGSTVTCNGNRTVTGPLTLANSATAGLDIGATAMNITGIYTQNALSTLSLTANSASTYGQITSAAAAVINAGSTVDITVGGFMPNGTTLTVVDAAAGAGVNVPNTITSSSDKYTFSGSTLNGDLILTVQRGGAAGGGFAADAKNSNAKDIAVVLDNMTDPNADMLNILNTLDGLSPKEVGDALDTMVPQDSGVINASVSSLKSFVSASIERGTGALRVASEASDGAKTGYSAGDEEKLNWLWAKGYGSYLRQYALNDVSGYKAWTTGTAAGVDRIFADMFILGISGGWAYGDAASDANNANTYVNSAQTTVYAGYRNDECPLFLNTSGSFGWNWYNGKRDIIVGPIQRRANASYDGQQYSVYGDAGYDIKLRENVTFTPLTSLHWNHLSLDKYTETEAGALGLVINRQSYDILEFGIGAGVNSVFNYKWGKLAPEAHCKWFYDCIGDPMILASNFTGGGTSFDARGFKPPRNSINAGGKLGITFNNDISVLLECDTEMKNRFFGIYGSAKVQYNF